MGWIGCAERGNTDLLSKPTSSSHHQPHLASTTCDIIGYTFAADLFNINYVKAMVAMFLLLLFTCEMQSVYR